MTDKLNPLFCAELNYTIENILDSNDDVMELLLPMMSKVIIEEPQLTLFTYIERLCKESQSDVGDFFIAAFSRCITDHLYIPESQKFYLEDLYNQIIQSE